MEANNNQLTENKESIFASAKNFSELREACKQKLLNYHDIAKRFPELSHNKVKMLLYQTSEDFPLCDAPDHISRLLDAIRQKAYQKKAEERAKRTTMTAARGKNRRLVSSYEYYKASFCNGLGQRRLKLLLNRLAKNGDDKAALFRTALELEDVNINAKKYFNTRECSYQDRLYERKEDLLKTLIEQCRAYNERHPESPLMFGYENVDDHSTSQIVYFHLPDTEQISFHCNLPRPLRDSMSKYEKPWDGKVNSTLGKMEDALMRNYATEITEYKKHFKN